MLLRICTVLFQIITVRRTLISHRKKCIDDTHATMKSKKFLMKMYFYFVLGGSCCGQPCLRQICTLDKIDVLANSTKIELIELVKPGQMLQGSVSGLFSFIVSLQSAISQAFRLHNLLTGRAKPAASPATIRSVVILAPAASIYATAIDDPP